VSFAGRYAINLELTGEDLEREVDSGLEYSFDEGYESGLAEARYEYEDKLNEDGTRGQLEELIRAVEAAHLEHDVVWPVRQCDHPACKAAERATVYITP